MSINGICHQYVWNQTNDWSWICYYYPIGSEDPLDQNMIYRAVEEYEKTNPKASRILLRKFENTLDNSLLSSNETNSTLSKESSSLLFILLLILLIIICGCCCKKKPTPQLKNRSSEDSEYSQESNDDDSIE